MASAILGVSGCFTSVGTGALIVGMLVLGLLSLTSFCSSMPYNRLLNRSSFLTKAWKMSNLASSVSAADSFLSIAPYLFKDALNSGSRSA